MMQNRPARAGPSTGATSSSTLSPSTAGHPSAGEPMYVDFAASRARGVEGIANPPMAQAFAGRGAPFAAGPPRPERAASPGGASGHPRQASRSVLPARSPTSRSEQEAMRRGAAKPQVSDSPTSSVSTTPTVTPPAGQAHERGTCKPCLYFVGASCRKGSACTYCHLQHSIGKIASVRPSKRMRECLERRARRAADPPAVMEEAPPVFEDLLRRMLAACPRIPCVAIGGPVAF
mmetsp:Transcript_56721/g.159211  ORF Transcript_56721/g.159211 Transcript_56721/m.159211 type:complete len:233 (+) Transcript_56721:33-731(+)